MNLPIYKALLISNIQQNLLDDVRVDKRVYKKLKRVQKDLSDINKIINNNLDEDTIEEFDKIAWEIEKAMDKL